MNFSYLVAEFMLLSSFVLLFTIPFLEYRLLKSQSARSPLDFSGKQKHRQQTHHLLEATSFAISKTSPVPQSTLSILESFVTYPVSNGHPSSNKSSDLNCLITPISIYHLSSPTAISISDLSPKDQTFYLLKIIRSLIMSLPTPTIMQTVTIPSIPIPSTDAIIASTTMTTITPSASSTNSSGVVDWRHVEGSVLTTPTPLTKAMIAIIVVIAVISAFLAVVCIIKIKFTARSGTACEERDERGEDATNVVVGGERGEKNLTVDLEDGKGSEGKEEVRSGDVRRDRMLRLFD